MAQYLVVRAWLEEALGPGGDRHLVFTTDPERGVLREIATGARASPTLDVPPAVGGRFSVLSPVGLLPAALIGIDIAALLAGPERALERAEAARPAARTRPALYAGAALGRRHAARRAHQRAHAVQRPTARLGGVVPPALGREPGQARRPSGRRGLRRADARAAPWAPPTSTARCSCSWRGRSTR